MTLPTSKANGAPTAPSSGSRRRFLRHATVVAASGTFMPFARAQSQGIVVTCLGGHYEKAIRACFAVPYT